MQYEILHRSSDAAVRVTLDAGESLGARRGAMVDRSANLRTGVTSEGGLGGMLSRALSDEREVLSDLFEADADGAQVTLAPDHPGDVVPLDLARTGRLKVKSRSPLAWSEGVDKRTDVYEASSFFSSGDLTVLALDGGGTVFLSAYGAVYEEEVSEDSPLVVDEDHLLAWTDGLGTTREREGSVTSAFLGGDGYVVRFAGEGRIWLQTRDPRVFANAVRDGG